MNYEDRYPWYLRKAAGGKWPQTIVTVAVNGETMNTPGFANVREERFDSWCGDVLVRNNNNYDVVHSEAGGTVEGFWSALRYAVENSGLLWCVSFNACRVWNLLKFWEKLENEDIDLFKERNQDSVQRVRGNDCDVSESDERSRKVGAGSVYGMLAECYGFLVAENPPNIARFRLAGLSRWVMWVDLRNYGVECIDDREPARTVVTCLSTAVQSISATLHTAKLGSLKTTAASQAMHGFRCSYYTGSILIHDDQTAIGIEGDSYHGGRCETRFVGVCRENLWHIDYRSLYPSVCRDCLLPEGIKRVYVSGQCGESLSESDCQSSIAEVDIETDEPAYPYRRTSGKPATQPGNAAVGPHIRDYYGKDIIYPVGHFRTTLAGPELLDAYLKSRIRRLHQRVSYRMAYTLRDYAIALDQARTRAEQVGDIVSQELIKRLMVGLPGKFAQSLQMWKYVPDAAAFAPYCEWFGADLDGKPATYRTIAWNTFMKVYKRWSSLAVPQIAAWITSAGRMKLLEAIRCAGWENVRYYDTDSLFVTEEGYDRLNKNGFIAVGEMGKLQVKDVDSCGEFRGIKQYTFAGRHVNAAIPKGFCYTDSRNGYAWHTASAAEQIRKGERPGCHAVLINMNQVKEYTHGTIWPDGRVTSPEIMEW